MRGRKKKENAKTKVISIRVTEEQYDILNKNEWIKKELIDQVNKYLNAYVVEKNED